MKKICIVALAFLELCVSTVNAAIDPASLERLELVIELVEENAYNPPMRNVGVDAAIRGYMQSIDEYSTYLTPQEYVKWKNSQAPEFSGVGIDLLIGRDGRVYCVPWKNSPAEIAGMNYRDILLSVDDEPVTNLSAYGLQSLIRGVDASRVKFNWHDGEQVKSAVLIRRNVSRNSVSLITDNRVPIIQISCFDSNTLPQLQAILTRLTGGMPVILDLRGNVGGELQAATACASLFTPKDTVLIWEQRRNEASIAHKSVNMGTFNPGQIIIWQDSFTASAAEAFCVALVQNNAGFSMGETSFGKGVSQRLMEAASGAAFVMTDSLLLDPRGVTWNATGIEPQMKVSPATEQNLLIQSAIYLEQSTFETEDR